MTSNNDFIEIPSTHVETRFPFKIGELVTGTVLNKKSNGTYLILLGHTKYKVKYLADLKERQLFKVLKNQGQLVLQLISSKERSSQSNQIIHQFTQLNSSENDSLLHEIVKYFLKYNLVPLENDILTLYRFVKQNYPGIDYGLLETLIAMKAKGLKTTPINLKSWITYDQKLSQLGKDLSQLIQRNNHPLIPFLDKHYFISPKKKDIKHQILKNLIKMGYISKNNFPPPPDEKIAKKQKGLFLLELLKSISQNKNNNLLKSILEHYQTERISTYKSPSEEDQFFFSIPLLMDDHVTYFKVKCFPKAQKKNHHVFYFEWDLNYLKKVHGYCIVDQDKISIDMNLEDKDKADFVNQYFLKTHKNGDYPINPEHFNVSYGKGLESFLSIQHP